MEWRPLLTRPLGRTHRYWRFLWRERQWWFNRVLPPKERDTAIYVGLPGAAKTTTAVDLAIGIMRSGVAVASNSYLRDNYTGAEAIPVRTWLDVLRVTVEYCELEEPLVVFLAEIQLLCDSRRWQDSPDWWGEMMQQRRHMGLSLMADTQDIGQVEVRLRMLCGQVIQVRPSWLREHWRRWPVVLTRKLTPETGIDPKLWVADHGWKHKWLPSWAFHGHSSWELLSGQDFGDLKEPKALKEIEALRQRALAANKVAGLPAFSDGETGSRSAYYPSPEDYTPNPSAPATGA
jgi:hypothetical protein